MSTSNGAWPPTWLAELASRPALAADVAGSAYAWLTPFSRRA
ncbi:MAG: hypothetical protein ACK2T6_08390 [Anaerolineae bacterium]